MPCGLPDTFAQTLYWDVNGATAGAGGATPTGNWRTSGAGVNWGTAADGTSSTALWTNNSIAVFSAGNDATGSFTVTVSSVLADSIVVEEGNITFNSSTITLTGATPSVEVASGLTATFASGVAGTNGFVKEGTGTVVFQGTGKSFAGNATINAGTLRLGAGNMIGNTVDVNVASGATFDLNGFSDTIGSLAGAGNLTLGAGTLTVDGDGETTEFSGAISGTGGLTKSGTDTLVLSGANSYTGATSVTAGVLNIRHSTALGTTDAGTSITTGEALELQGGIAVGAEALTITGSGVSATGALRNIGDSNSYGGLITLTGNTQFTADAGDLTLTGGVTGANRTLTLTGDGDITISGAIATVTGALNKRGTGTLTLSGANTYTGATVIGTSGGSSGGTLRLGASDALSNATTTIYAGTLDLNGNSDTIGALSLGGGATGTAATVTTGAGTLTLGGNITYSATNNTNGAVISGLLDLGGANRTFTVGNSTNADDDLTVSAGISGNAGLIKQGSGTLVLSGASTYTGATAVSSGVLNIRHSAALGTTDAGTTVTSGDQLQVQGGISVGNEALSLTGTGIGSTGALRNVSGDNAWAGQVTLAGTTTIYADAGNLSLTGGVTGVNRTLTLDGDGNFSIADVTTGTGVLNKNGAGTATLTGTNTYTGDTNVNTGTLRLGSGATLSDASDLIIDAGATFDLNGQADAVRSIAGAGNITLGNGTLSTVGTASTTFSGVMSGNGAFTKDGTATLTLSGANTYTGATTVSAGILRAGASETIADVSTVTVAAGATFDVNNQTETVAGIAGAGTFDLGSGTLVVAGDADSVFTGAIIGSGGALTKQGAGTLTLSGVSTYTGTTAIEAGTLELGASDILSNSTAVTISSGATFDVNDQTESIATIAGGGTVDLGVGVLIAAGSGSTTFSGVLEGTGTFTKQGSGTLTLDNSFDFNGTFNLAGGTLRLSDIALSVDTLNITGDSIIDFAGASSLDVANFTISDGVTLTIQNWADVSDYFFTQNWTGAVYEVRGNAPMNQITFDGFAANDTKWQSYDNQITPVPEPGAYGSLLLALMSAGAWLWRRRLTRPAV